MTSLPVVRAHQIFHNVLINFAQIQGDNREKVLSFRNYKRKIRIGEK